MAETVESQECVQIDLQCQRNAELTLPWFVPDSHYPPRPGNVIEPLINGQRAFAAVAEAINGAKKSIDIVSWGFDPSMRLIRPGGERLGDLLRRKADKFSRNDGSFLEPSVPVRVLIWKNVLAGFAENNIPGDGLAGSGGGTGLGSGVGGLDSAGGGSGADEEFNNYASKIGNSAAIQRGDDEAKAYNRRWFDYQPPSLEFRTRDFSFTDRLSIARQQIAQRGMASPTRTYLLTDFASHHQKMVLIDYESPEDAIGFVMGHNMLRNYWDNDDHAYYSDLRDGFAPWQDLSCRVRGPALFDLNENFMTAWDRAESGGKKIAWSDARLARKSEDFLVSGRGFSAQICRTQPQENDRSILSVYRQALSNARNYIYFENQYFRYAEFADLIRTTRRRLKSAGWQRDFYIFVVTNITDGTGRLNTYEMLDALGKGQSMPTVHKNASGDRSEDSALRRSDLEGVNSHVGALLSSGQQSSGVSYKSIYVHSKLLLVDDVFFTLGSANVNVRSMETDSELNIAAPAPELTRHWREHLWRIHTGRPAQDDMQAEHMFWSQIMADNADDKRDGSMLSSKLVEFFDDQDATFAPD